jgi:hypothetical protein
MKRHDNIYNGIGGFLNTYQTQIWVIILVALILQCCLAIVIRRVELAMKPQMRLGILEVSFWLKFII